ncbi:hypothetical protein ACFL6K_05870 [Candidatus Latescibacterota bacterium]
MRKYWKLYIKELRFLLWPAIVIFAVQIVAMAFIMFTENHVPENQSLFFKYLSFMFVMIAVNYAYILGALFLYSLVYEHSTSAQYQLYSLPLRRWKHIAVKFAAICTWVTFFYVGISLFVSAISLKQEVVFNQFFSEPQPFKDIIISTISMINYIALMCSLVMIGYVAATCIKRFPVFVGTATVFAGYFFYRKFYLIMYSKFAADISWVEWASTGQPVISPWFNVIFRAAMVILFIVSALFLYEKYSEV